MKFKMIHENYNVTDLDRSLSFYDQALGLKESDVKLPKMVLSSLCILGMKKVSLNSN